VLYQGIAEELGFSFDVVEDLLLYFSHPLLCIPELFEGLHGLRSLKGLAIPRVWGTLTWRR